MPLPLKKINNAFHLNLSKEIFLEPIIERSLQTVPFYVKKSVPRNKKYLKLMFKDFNSALEFSNYLLFLSR